MRNATRSLRTVLVVAAAITVAALPGVRSAVPTVVAQAGQAPASDRARFVGTYRLLTIEVKDARGTWSQRPGFRSVGYITYSDSGHMGVYIMPRNRTMFAAAQPTGEEARAALEGYTAYFGPFTVDDKDKFVVHHRVGQISPSGPSEAKRFYDFEGDRLVLTPAPADGGGKEKATNRLIWERLPNAPLSAEARKFVGVYRLVYEDSYRQKDGKEIFHGDKVYGRAGTSYIIYTPTGHMMAHLMQKDGRTKYAGAQPTPDEALKAYQTYGGYFGRFTTYENYTPRFVLHNQQGTLRPGGEVDATKRFYEFSGNILRLAPPPTVNAAGETAGRHLYWEKLTGNDAPQTR